MEMNNNQKILLALLYCEGHSDKINEPIVGSIKLMKESFLIGQELDTKFYTFVPYDLGPCSFKIYEDLSMFVKMGLVQEFKDKKDVSTYMISDLALKIVKTIIETLDKEKLRVVRDIKKTYNNWTYYRLVSYVYEKFPKYKVNSKFL